MADANDLLFQASVRHAITVRRYGTNVIQQMLAILRDADQALAAKLREQLAKLGVPLNRADYKAARLKTTLDDVRAARAAAFAEINSRVGDDLRDFAPLESKVEEQNITESVPIDIVLTGVDLRTVRALVENSPFQGSLLEGWFSQLTDLDQFRIQQALNIGLVNGEGIDSIVRRVVGSRANNYEDGVVGITRRNAEAIVRTAVNHVSNAARAEVWDANKDIMKGERWTSVLDGRTTPICQARDGMVFPVGEGPRPPAHLNCRSVMVGVLDGIGIVGDRPYVSDTRTRQQREVDFRSEARDSAGSEWSNMNASERNAAIREIRTKWADANIGRVPAVTTYQDWLSQQSASFQDEVLGQRKGQLFRAGGLTVQQFVDRQGNSLTLRDLQALYPEAWAKAGLP